MKCAADDHNHVCVDEESAVGDYHDVHSMCGSVSSQEATGMADAGAAENEGGMATDELDIQIDDTEPMFKSAMEIFSSQQKRELRLDLWNNRPATKYEAIDRAILLQARDTPQ